MSLPFPRSGLYAITGEGHSSLSQLLEAVGQALKGGARVLQYRSKSARDRSTEAEALLAACHDAGVPLIINDDVTLAERIGADGVHLGKDDEDLVAARRRLGPGAIIGVSCYDSMDRALQAEREGASYVAFGRFFPSRSKPEAPCASLETLREAKRRLSLPIVAIGGITAENAGILIAAGADLVAVIDGVFGAEDPQLAASRLQRLFSSD
jgi:thiamine-phosphate pyrophosphorylase